MSNDANYELLVMPNTQLANISGGADFIADLAEDEYELEVSYYEHENRTHFKLVGTAVNARRFVNRIAGYGRN